MATALISVYDKTNLIPFLRFLNSKGWNFLASGGTGTLIKEEGLPVRDVSEFTASPEMFEGRVKTLHPKIHGGILMRRNHLSDQSELEENGLEKIDMVIVNLYPFFEAVRKNLSDEEIIEFIDIGGPTLLRSAAKNHSDVIVISSPEDYPEVQKEIEAFGEVTSNLKRNLAGKVFALTSAYDAAIAEYLKPTGETSRYLTSPYVYVSGLRYGENPHQKATIYEHLTQPGAMKGLRILGGKELSFNNMRDLDTAWKVAHEFDRETACCAVKHSIPCGVALGSTAVEAYKKAFEGDPVSIFGGIVAFTVPVDKETALELKKTFLEVIAAPSFTEKALAILREKKNLRIVEPSSPPKSKDVRIHLDGVVLTQDVDSLKPSREALDFVTESKPSDEEIEDLIFGMRVAKYIKSNAVLLAKNAMTTGIGSGETNRIDATRHAIERAGKKRGVLASDAFFPFRDVIDLCAGNGIRAIIQPGGSVRDQESIDACNANKISMVFTGVRHFLH